MTAATDAGIFRFTMQIAGKEQYLELDPDITKFTGEEVLLVETHGKCRLRDWFERVANTERSTGTDLLLIGFLASNRAQIAEHGTSNLDWAEFARVAAPLTLRKADASANADAPAQN
ncbi:hypothetical protein DMP17_22195 [Pseudonocardia sp. TMWB2A]|uniref:hypothetical protein n=1 Tax=Pseudonocardia sp. TMWB2A TaxID=687430 RepID=UPI00307E6EFF